ncbi:hypothetical protein TVAG_258680 [Trichomonas vaginalis G3]|uniref:Uncharacterized protein n=1 Tax=Trichomonas vaginalis (strain ATCC PRA-98 / G3) TaxID=412133 RepID=A2GPJ9_TRIV3|nr:hypothetical protein TVAG_258680 [Trichomonas vaginalis G3]|eukprot:XP_001293850.1 hypothetical protein [Trichomonas vaginalis G3]
MSSSSSSRESSPSMKQTLPNDYGAPIEYFLRAAQWQRAVSPRLGVPPAPVKNSIWSSPYIRYGLPLGLLATAGAVMMLKRNKANVVNNTEVAEVKQTPTPSQAKPSIVSIQVMGTAALRSTLPNTCEFDTLQSRQPLHLTNVKNKRSHLQKYCNSSHCCASHNSS